MGAWIETDTTGLHFTEKKSHPLWVRGLKHGIAWCALSDLEVAPFVGAWIETDLSINSVVNNKSHPLWVRGLKHNYLFLLQLVTVSHPLWVRGLKRNACSYSHNHPSRTLCGCVD